jgi:hypothetical protein
MGKKMIMTQEQVWERVWERIWERVCSRVFDLAEDGTAYDAVWGMASQISRFPDFLNDPEINSRAVLHRVDPEPQATVSGAVSSVILLHAIYK